MDWLLSLAFWLTISISRLLVACIVCPLAKFAIGYVCYMLVGCLITILIKLRYEVYNEDLRLESNSDKKRVLVITGASSGIGLAVACHFLRRGFVVVACYFSKAEPGYDQLVALTGSGATQESNRLHLVELDVRSQESIASCHATVTSILVDDPELRLHALINVAGVGVMHKFQWTPQAMIRNIVDTNLTGPLLMTRQFLHLLISTPEARLINVASPLALFPATYSAVYAPTKAALTHFASVLKSDTMKHDLKTVTIQPGNLIMNTAILDSSLNQKMDRMAEQLSDEEKALHKDEMDRHQKLVDLVAKKHARATPFKDLRPSGKFVTLLTGGLIEDKLQHSGSFFKSFDNAVCLRDPPKEMFAGNMLFNLLAAAFFQWAPRVILRDATLSCQQIIGW
jgi:NAD(P)-dependent dehydrogenase (short-subunit alcohol dehydrogenase family)